MRVLSGCPCLGSPLEVEVFALDVGVYCCSLLVVELCE